MSITIIEPNLTFSGSFSNRASTDYIALHHAEASTCSVQDVHAWHLGNGWIGIGYHFFVRKNGSIYRGRPIWAMGAHVEGMNNCSIGICAEGSYMTETMPDAQKKAIAELLDYLKTDYYPNAKIVGHKEIGDSDCPGVNYPLDELKNYKNLLGGSTHWAAEYLSRLASMGYATDKAFWGEYDAPTPKSQCIALIDKATGGTWGSEEADASVHWVQPSVISLCGKGIVKDKTQWLTNADGSISAALLLALVDNATGGMKSAYVGRNTDHWGRNHLDSLCDKAIITTPAAWTNFEGEVTRGNTMALVCKAFGI